MNTQQMDNYQQDDQQDNQQENQYVDDQDISNDDMGDMNDHQDGMVFVSVDGDSIGSEVGSAILSDDIQRLHEVSQSINHGQNLLMDWAEQNGGQVISAGGDEAILHVPYSSLDGLEDLRNQYNQTVGATLTVGVGSKPSEAGKALLYGKLNGKDQINEFHPEMDEFLMEAHQHAESGQGSEEEQKQDDAYLSDMYEDGQDSQQEDNQFDNSDESFDEETGDNDQNLDSLEQNNNSDDYDNYDVHDDSEGTEGDLDAPEAANIVDEAGVQEGSDESEESDMKDAMKDELSQPDSNLKQKLAEVLEAYKMDKESLEQMSNENPEMYSEVLQLLQQMISVAKMLSSQPNPQPDNSIPPEQQSNITGSSVGKQIP